MGKGIKMLIKQKVTLQLLLIFLVTILPISVGNITLTYGVYHTINLLLNPLPSQIEWTPSSAQFTMYLYICFTFSILYVISIMILLVNTFDITPYASQKILVNIAMLVLTSVGIHALWINSLHEAYTNMFYSVLYLIIAILVIYTQLITQKMLSQNIFKKMQ